VESRLESGLDGKDDGCNCGREIEHWPAWLSAEAAEGSFLPCRCSALCHSSRSIPPGVRMLLRCTASDRARLVAANWYVSFSLVFGAIMLLRRTQIKIALNGKYKVIFFLGKGLQKKKKRDALPLTAEGTAATQQLPSCCQGRSQRERQPRPPLLSHQRGKVILSQCFCVEGVYIQQCF
jgi:hypothetical protein